ncbi:MAG: ATP-binding protein [Oscillospiraceae bacterium]|nr:ATP-binding protein [Oscillospiraceae bacterium]
MTRTEIRHLANAQMEQRRNRAVAAAEERRKEIYSKLPQIKEMQTMLAQTSVKLSQSLITNKGDHRQALEEIRKNNTECRRMIADTLTAAGYPEDHLEIHYRCQICEDTGFTDRAMCDCLKRLINKIASDELNRDANMPNADFAHFDLNMYRDVNINGIDAYKLMSNVAAFCRDYAKNFSMSSQSLLMIGNPGLGKTHLSVSIAKEVINLGHSVIYGSVVDRLRDIEREHFGRAEEDRNVLDLLLETDLLVLDDLGSEQRTPFYESTLYNIINTRINTSRPTIISTNLTWEELSQMYNERLISRLAYVYKRVGFIGRDVRAIMAGM